MLLSGREIIIRSHILEFKHPGSVLHFIPYYVPEDKRSNYVDESHSLEFDQRNEWWMKYGKAIGEDFAGIPQDPGLEKLESITSQPLLNYLVALSYMRKRIDFSREDNVNRIYEDLLDSVYERDWHDYHCQVPMLKSVTREDLQTLHERAEKGITQLLATFYFRQSEYTRGENPLFEFTHKTFREYLTAKTVVRLISTISDELRRHDGNSDTGWDEKDSLVKFVKLFGPSPLDEYLLTFVVNELKLISESELAGIQNALRRLLEYDLKNLLPMGEITRDYRIAVPWSRNSEETLFVLLTNCTKLIPETFTKIDCTDPEAFGDFLHRLGRGGRLASANLSPIDLSDCNLSYLYLAGFNMIRSRLHRAKLVLANLFAAELVGADLSNANLIAANLYHANLSGADLSGVDMSYANLHEANLSGANLSNADLSTARLSKVNFSKADLSHANLFRADLAQAILTAANLHRAMLLEASLTKADLSGANVSCAILCRANLSRARLSKADLSDTDLRDADISEADLSNANLRGANLSGANLSGANLSNTDFSNANLSETILPKNFRRSARK